MAEAAQAPRKRPLSPHLQVYRLTLSMIMSGLHRITGLALVAGMVLITWWLLAAAAGQNAYGAFEAFSTTDFPENAWERVGPDLVILYPSGFHRAQLTVARLERLLGVQVTLRNWRTTTKLAELAAAG